MASEQVLFIYCNPRVINNESYLHTITTSFSHSAHNAQFCSIIYSSYCIEANVMGISCKCPYIGLNRQSTVEQKDNVVSLFSHGHSQNSAEFCSPVDRHPGMDSTLTCKKHRWRVSPVNVDFVVPSARVEVDPRPGRDVECPHVLGSYVVTVHVFAQAYHKWHGLGRNWPEELTSIGVIVTHPEVHVFGR